MDESPTDWVEMSQGLEVNSESVPPLSFSPQTGEACSVGLYQIQWLKFWP